MPHSFNICRSGFEIRLATPADAKAVRMLLPELRDAAFCLVAIDGRHQLVIGAAAATFSRRMKPLAGPGIAIRVIESCRNCGVGGALLEHMEAAMTATGAESLYAAQRVELGSDAFLGWERLGFSPCATVEEHILPLNEFEPRLAPLVDRFRAQGRIPDSARIIPLYQADAAAVLQLHLDHMGGDRGDLERKLRTEGPGAFHPRYSRVLLLDDRVKGCILAHRADKETASVDANILDPRARGGWANVWLKLEATRGALSLGIKNFRFRSFDHYFDTRSFTKKFGGVTVRTSVLMIRPLGGHTLPATPAPV